MRKYGIVIADKGEFDPLVAVARMMDGFSSGKERGRDYITFQTKRGSLVKAVCCGIGKVNAATTAAFLLAEGADLLINAGFSGSLTGEVRRAFILATKSFEADFDLTPLGYEEFCKPGQEFCYPVKEWVLTAARKALPEAVVAPVACGDLFLTDAARGKHLHETYNTVAFDMESGAVASVCYHSDRPFLILREVSDGADEKAAEEYGTNSTSAEDLSSAILVCLDSLDKECEIG